MAQKKSIGALSQKYSGSIRGSKTSITRDMAKELLELFNEKGTFTVPVEEFNQIVGLDDNTARAWQLKRILNKQHFDLLDENQEWRVGQTAQNTLYVFSIRAKKE